MEDSLLTTLLNTTNPDALQALAQTYSFDIATLQELKELSARFYFTDPEKSKRIAEAAYRLGQLLPDPAPALGQWTLANALMYVE